MYFPYIFLNGYGRIAHSSGFFIPDSCNYFHVSLGTKSYWLELNKLGLQPGALRAQELTCSVLSLSNNVTLQTEAPTKAVTVAGPSSNSDCKSTCLNLLLA